MGLMCPLYASRRRVGSRAYLVVLDGEEDETVRVLLQHRLVRLLRLDCGRNFRLFLRLLLEQRDALDGDGDLVGIVAGVGGVIGVLLVSLSVELRLLDGGLHLEVFDGGRGLHGKDVSGRVARFSATTS